jgi:hypothetical protein
MNETKLSFSKTIFMRHQTIVFLLCMIPLMLDGLSTRTLMFSIGLLFFYLIVSIIRSKSFSFNNNTLSVSYIFLKYKINIRMEDIERILYHRKKRERDWNYIKVSFKNGKSKKLNFSFIKQECRDVFL